MKESEKGETLKPNCESRRPQRSHPEPGHQQPSRRRRHQAGRSDLNHLQPSHKKKPRTEINPKLSSWIRNRYKIEDLAKDASTWSVCSSSTCNRREKLMRKHNLQIFKPKIKDLCFPKVCLRAVTRQYKEIWMRGLGRRRLTWFWLPRSARLCDPWCSGWLRLVGRRGCACLPLVWVFVRLLHPFRTVIGRLMSIHSRWFHNVQQEQKTRSKENPRNDLVYPWKKLLGSLSEPN